MSDGRLAAGVEVSAFVRRAEAEGGFGAVLHKGDSERGAILLVLAERGEPKAIFERMLGRDGRYGWERSGPSGGGSGESAAWLERRRRSDPDCWVVELDIPDSQRFIAETLSGA